MKMKRLFAALLLCCLVILPGCGADRRQEEEKWVLEEEKAITFSDGESANLWRTNHSGSDIYKLSDGTILLTIHDPIGPDNVSVIGIESFDDLSESAQKAVSAFFEEQGLLYDTRSELENAYAEYLACKESGIEYNGRHVRQEIVPTASNENIMCFITSVTLPMNGQMAQELRLGAVFDKKTGEIMSNWDLFTLPEKEARQRLLDAFNVADPTLRAEMEAALKPEYIILLPDNLEVAFPLEAMPSQDYINSVGVDYNEIRTILQPWAIPENPE
jgi:hypothetical protein